MKNALKMTASILKLRIAFFVTLAALIGILTAGGAMGGIEASVFLLAVLGASGAAGAFNQYFERDSDRLMVRTHKRPFACGTLKPSLIWPITFGLLSVGALLMGWSVGGTLATLLVFLGAVTYAFLYTMWLKRSSVWNVVIGGASGSFAVLAGAAAAAPDFGPVFEPVPILLAAALFLWTPPHFWALVAAKDGDYRRAGIPMLPVVSEHTVWGRIIFIHVFFLVIISLSPLLYGLGPIYGVCAAIGGARFLQTSWVLMRNNDCEAAMITFRASLLQFALLCLGVILDRVVAL